jgi:hypothetical protein
MATLIHQALLDADIAVPPPRVTTAKLAGARRGAAYTARLAAAGGLLPYRWSLAGRLPAGLHLQSTGVVAGTPRRIDHAGTFTFVVQVRDAAGVTGTRKLVLRLR